MANSNYTYDQVKSGTGYFAEETGISISIKRLQTKQKRNGYYTGSINGVFNAETTTAVKLLQSEAGIGATGYVDNS